MCLDFTKVVDYIYGDSNKTQEAVVDKHLEECNVCQEWVEGLMNYILAEDLSKEALLGLLEESQGRFEKNLDHLELRKFLPSSISSKISKAFALLNIVNPFKLIDEFEKKISQQTQLSFRGKNSFNIYRENFVTANELKTFEKVLFELETIIEDELRLELFCGSIDQAIQTHTINKDQTLSKNFSISIVDLPPGRYYWRLKPKSRPLRKVYGSCMGVFLIQKELDSTPN